MPCFRANTLLAWHGTSSTTLPLVLQAGFANLRSTDGGFFGAGCYFAQEAEYACRYSQYSAPNADGEWPVILCCLAVGCVYPVTPDVDYPPRADGHLFSKFYAPPSEPALALQTPCDAHYVPVRKYPEFVHDDFQVGFRALPWGQA